MKTYHTVIVNARGGTTCTNKEDLGHYERRLASVVAAVSDVSVPACAQRNGDIQLRIVNEVNVECNSSSPP